MNARHVHREAKRTPEETAQLRADRERYQKNKPSPEQLLAEGGHEDFVPMGELLQIHQVAFSLKKERERQGITLAQLEEFAGIDQAALSRLENGKNVNPTLDTLQRIAAALNKTICCTLRDAPEQRPELVHP